ncbi:hypothetical protein PGB90_004019 [Kerria lacca]
MNEALTNISKWLENHHLEMAAAKSKAIVVFRRRNVKNNSPILSPRHRSSKNTNALVPRNPSRSLPHIPATY